MIGVRASYGPFVRAAARHGSGPVAFVLVDTDDAEAQVQRYATHLAVAGARVTRPVVVSPDRPPRASDLDGASGVFVCGGSIPRYQEVLVGQGSDWLEPARERGVPYGGFSAGAAVAAARAVVGGWQVEERGARVEICPEEYGEGLDLVTCRPGLGVVPFAVEVHAAQWGTLARLVHAVRLGCAAEGWAIDEAAAVEVSDGAVVVHGPGAAHRVRATAAGVDVVFQAGGAPVAGAAGG